MKITVSKKTIIDGKIIERSISAESKIDMESPYSERTDEQRAFDLSVSLFSAINRDAMGGIE